MKRAALAISLIAALGSASTWTGAQEARRPADGPVLNPDHFHAVPVYVDAGKTPLAAYQINIRVVTGPGAIVGIENGAHESMDRPPYYDGVTLDRGHAERVVIAWYSLLKAERLATGRVRVATIHLMTRSKQPPTIRAKLVAAAGADGKPIQAAIELEERNRP